MKNIVFFNYLNRGDIFCSRPFVQELIENINVNFYYAHNWGEVILRDLNLKYIQLNNLSGITPQREWSNNSIQGETVYINTWIGKYFNKLKPRCGECNLLSLYELMYCEIYEFINNTFNLNLKLKDVINYFPSIDYSYFNTDKVNKFIKKNQSKKILLCNGPALSGQCEYNGDMSEIIINLANKYKHICFIITQNINCNLENVKCTSDIIQSNGCDLNEISHLSTFCDIIVGRSSGPFTFSNVKENIFDNKKTFLCFGEKGTDCLPYDLDIECQFVFEPFSTIQNLQQSIEELINDIK